MDKDFPATATDVMAATPMPPTGGEWAGRLLVLAIVACCVAGAVLIGKGPASSKLAARETGGADILGMIQHSTGPGIALVRFSGVLQFSSESSVYGLSRVSPTESLVRQLKQVQADANVKGVVLRVNSPGGTLPASQEVAHQVRQIAKKMPIVISMADMAASGGYYISAPATYIFCDPGTMTGSIGVIMSLVHYEDLARHYGVTFPTFTSGDFKDMGSPTRPMRPDEVILFQQYVHEARDQFVRTVVQGRVTRLRMQAGMDDKKDDKKGDKKEGKKEEGDAAWLQKVGRKPELGLQSAEEVDKLADGRVYLGDNAVKLGLADALGDEDDAIAKCGLAVDLGEKPRVIKPNAWEEIFQGLGSSAVTEGKAFSLPTRLTAPVLALCPIGL